MAATIDQIRAHADRPQVCIEYDNQFHRMLAESVENVPPPLVLEPVGQLPRASRLATIHNPSAVGRSVAAHQEVLERVRACDVAGAREARRRRLDQVEGEIHRMKGEVGPS